jgi:hypothetical protein
MLESEFNEQFNSWSATRGVSIHSKNDFIYSLFNGLIFKTGQIVRGKKLYQVLRPIYFEMWRFLLYEEKPRSHVLKLMLYCDLILAEDENYKMRAQIIGSKCCDECDKLDGLNMPIEDAIMNQPLPVPNCTKTTGCACCYGFSVERDLRGKPVPKN